MSYFKKTSCATVDAVSSNNLLLHTPRNEWYKQKLLFTVKGIAVWSPENHIKKVAPQTAVL
jgi:hypothetical protein